MMRTIQLLSLLTTAVFLYIIFRLIIKGKLREEYSITWIMVAMVFTVFTIKPTLIDYFAKQLNVYYAPALLFLVLIFAILIILVHLSVVNSKQHQQIKKLSQDLALLKNKINDR